MHVLVSILIPAYNAEGTIAFAINSCLQQTYRELEILVLNDGSTDRTASVIGSFSDPRVRMLESKTNQGVAVSRNLLISEAKGEYIAWLDADDMMLPNRIDIQVGFMQANPTIDIAGSWIETDIPRLPVKKLPLHPKQIRTMLWFRNCMIQTSIISKNFYFEENIWYNGTEYPNSAEDYELWYTLSKHCELANIPMALTRYHSLTGQALEEKLERTGLKENLAKLWLLKWKHAGINVDQNDKNIFQDFIMQNRKLRAIEGNSILKTLKRLESVHTDKFYKLLASYHKLRLWNNLELLGKIRYCYLLANAISWFRMKRHYLLS